MKTVAKRKLNGAKKHQETGGAFAGLKTRLFGRADTPLTVQRSIPLKALYRNGICRVTDNLYTKTVAFEDTGYVLADEDGKTVVFEAWRDCLNRFDPSVSVQLTFVNRRTEAGEFETDSMPDCGDSLDPIRREYAGMIKKRLARNGRGFVKHRYITFGVEATGLKEAEPRLKRIETEVLNHLKALGADPKALDGAARLEVLCRQTHPEDGRRPENEAKPTLRRKPVTEADLSAIDRIAPSALDFRNERIFKTGAVYGAVSHLQILAPELSDRLLSDILGIRASVTVNIHIRTVAQAEAVKTVKRKLSDLGSMKISEQKKAVRAGYDPDVLPPDLVTYGNETQTLLDDLQSNNERLFLVTVLTLNTAATKRRLENDVFTASGAVQQHNCVLKRLVWQQEQGLMSSLVLGLNQIEIRRALTSSGTAAFLPFTTAELFQTGEALYYGVNPLSGNVIMADRKLLKNPNGLYLGTPGSGKSFAAKREIVNAFTPSGAGQCRRHRPGGSAQFEI